MNTDQQHLAAALRLADQSDAHYDRKEFNEAYQTLDKLCDLCETHETLVGSLIKFQVADSYACYLVTGKNDRFAQVRSFKTSYSHDSEVDGLIDIRVANRNHEQAKEYRHKQEGQLLLQYFRAPQSLPSWKASQLQRVKHLLDEKKGGLTKEAYAIFKNDADIIAYATVHREKLSRSAQSRLVAPTQQK